MAESFESFPVILGWELTLACNLRCRHCASAAGDPRPNELTIDEALDLCDQLPSLLVMELVFTGGEPLISPHWEKIAKRLQDLGIRTGMVTNGTCLGDGTIERLLDVGVTALAISLDGEPDTHDFMRGVSGLHQRVVAGIERVLEAGLRVTVITTVNGRSIRELRSMHQRLQSLGVKRWQLQPVFGFGRMQGSQNLLLSDADYLELGRFIKSSMAACEEGQLQIFPADGVGYFSELDVEGPRWRGCSAGITTCGIMSDGRVKGCLSWPDHLVTGDLRKNDLWDIWFHQDAFRQTRRFSVEDLSGNCRDCEKGEECRGGCSAMSYSETGLFHADPYCFRAILHRVESATAH